MKKILLSFLTLLLFIAGCKKNDDDPQTFIQLQNSFQYNDDHLPSRIELYKSSGGVPELDEYLIRWNGTAWNHNKGLQFQQQWETCYTGTQAQETTIATETTTYINAFDGNGGLQKIDITRHYKEEYQNTVTRDNTYQYSLNVTCIKKNR